VSGSANELTTLLASFSKILTFAQAHWMALVGLAPPVCALTLVYRFLVTRVGPADLTGTGIAVGGAEDLR
jgi:hypothetical protein